LEEAMFVQRTMDGNQIALGSVSRSVRGS